MNTDHMNRQELNDAMADYLGGELPPDQVVRFELSLKEHPDLASEVHELAKALKAMHALEPETKATNDSKPSSLQWGKGHFVRLAAMITLAFFIGYIVRGLDQGVNPGANPGAPSPTERVGEETGPSDTPRIQSDESFGTRYATEFLADGRRSGLSRSLIAYARATRKNSTKE
ncbi:MAG: hypothetical protein O7G85_07275 [Planctomycetota bacterium]|nr:hypothetical protein [Planctomycetota bacterium]